MRHLIVVLSTLVSSTVSADPDTYRFVARVVAMPDTKPDQAERAALAAVMLETERVPAEIMIAIAWGESRFDPTVKTGHVCGPMQTVPKSPGDCDRWTDMLEGFQAGRDELEDELRNDPRVHGDLRLALLAYACGNDAFRPDLRFWHWKPIACKKMNYPSVIFARARRLGWEAKPKPRS